MARKKRKASSLVSIIRPPSPKSSIHLRPLPRMKRHHHHHHHFEINVNNQNHWPSHHLDQYSFHEFFVLAIFFILLFSAAYILCYEVSQMVWYLVSLIHLFNLLAQVRVKKKNCIFIFTVILSLLCPTPSKPFL